MKCKKTMLVLGLAGLVLCSGCKLAAKVVSYPIAWGVSKYWAAHDKSPAPNSEKPIPAWVNDTNLFPAIPHRHKPGTGAL